MNKKSEKYNCQVSIGNHPNVFLTEDEYWDYENTFCELNTNPPDVWDELQRIIKMRESSEQETN